MTNTAACQQFEAETVLKLRNASAHRLGAQLETLACGQQASGIRDCPENSIEIPIHHFTEAPQTLLSIGIFRVSAFVVRSRMDWSQQVRFTKSVSHRSPPSVTATSTWRFPPMLLASPDFSHCSGIMARFCGAGC